MLRTRVGYAGGTSENPTYRQIGDHTEVFQVDYDPSEITFDQLLDEFWASHNPCRAKWSTQYKAILFYETAAEREIAKKSAAAIGRQHGQPVQTELRQLDRFYFAEDYHQKYSLRGHKQLFASVRGLFGSERAFAESRLATKLNAYLDGELTYERLGDELRRLGLRAVGDKRLERIEVLPKEPRTQPETQPTSRPSAR